MCEGYRLVKCRNPPRLVLEPHRAILSPTSPPALIHGEPDRSRVPAAFHQQASRKQMLWGQEPPLVSTGWENGTRCETVSNPALRVTWTANTTWLLVVPADQAQRPRRSLQLQANMLIMVVLFYEEIFFCFKEIKAQIYFKSSEFH